MDLGKTQLLSLITKAITSALGILQSLFVVRLLSRGEFGLVGLVMSIGGLIGVSQHLGIVDGTIREIAVLKDKREAGKVFWVSHLMRQLVTVPLTVGLVLAAGFIAQRLYHRPEITFYLQIFAASLILQGLQDVLGAALTGLKKFLWLYAVQIVTAIINIGVFAGLTWKFGMAGFFWAVIITTGVMVVWFFALIARELRGYLAWPTGQDIRQYGRRVLRIGVYMYLARIFFVVWQRLPLLLLGGVLTAERLGDLNVSLTFGSRLAIIAMALSEVNLSLMSSLFASKREEFQQVVTRNMYRVLVVMAAITLVLLFFTPEILRYVIGAQYLPSAPLILVMTLAFFLYSLTEIGTSSLFVSADQPRLRAVVYGAMMMLTGALVGWIFVTRPDALLASFAVLAGAAAAYLGMIWLAQHRFAISLLTPQLAIFLLALGGSVAWLFFGPSLWARAPVFAALLWYILREAHRKKLLPAWRKKVQAGDSDLRIICFATMYDAPYWTNRQHIMTRVAQHYPVLYMEPRIWVLRFLLRNWQTPTVVLRFLWRLIAWESRGNLYLVSQWNLLPGSRESRIIAKINHYLNRWRILFIAQWLGFRQRRTVIWLYETEAAEYLSAFKYDVVVYDCVDDHVAQAGAERNPARVREEETKILQRADLVTVTSRHLYELKKGENPNVHLVLNAGDVTAFLPSPQVRRRVGDEEKYPLTSPSSPRLGRGGHPRIGTVGALDEYKIDLDMMARVARARPNWQFVFVGKPVVHPKSRVVKQLQALPNMRFTGVIARHEVPRYVAGFDVCMIPYRLSAYNKSSFPLKFWEFMATGRPIVVSGLPELKIYQPLIGYAKRADDFIALCEAALEDPKKSREERIKLAREHSWEKRVARLLELLSKTVNETYENRI